MHNFCLLRLFCLLVKEQKQRIPGRSRYSCTMWAIKNTPIPSHYTSWLKTVSLLWVIIIPSKPGSIIPYSNQLTRLFLMAHVTSVVAAWISGTTHSGYPRIEAKSDQSTVIASHDITGMVGWSIVSGIPVMQVGGIPTGWGPPVISWFINHYKHH